MDYLKTLQEKISLLLNKLDKTKLLNESLESKNEYLIKVNKDLEAKIKIMQLKEKQLKIVSAITEDDSDKQYFKNKIDYLIKEIDYCIDRISI
uniref:Uncharacterized protein n=1 Tax=uncultured Flavobacteriia bacterium TaxID=212695 RepID=H6RH89_9BACT|nr:hypothetical protein [uncultured bacterium]CCG00360.1 hypothetical protein VIS_S18DAB70005 [uncultured Flavobacteriia bacterium]CCG00400.1 hypothetical protein VIS_S18_DB-B8_0005 [uncultured Flavobacteriia bacterium]